MERREAPGACEAPQGCVRCAPHWQALCERARPRATAKPGYPDLPLEARGPSDVGACASRRSTGRWRVFPLSAVQVASMPVHEPGPPGAPRLSLRDAS